MALAQLKVNKGYFLQEREPEFATAFPLAIFSVQ